MCKFINKSACSSVGVDYPVKRQMWGLNRTVGQASLTGWSQNGGGVSFQNCQANKLEAHMSLYRSPNYSIDNRQ